MLPVRNTFVQFDTQRPDKEIRRCCTWHVRQSAGFELSDADFEASDAEGFVELMSSSMAATSPFQSLGLPAWALLRPGEMESLDKDDAQLPTIWARPAMFRRPPSFSQLCLVEDEDQDKSWEEATACSTPGGPRWADLADSEDEALQRSRSASAASQTQARWAELANEEAMRM